MSAVASMTGHGAVAPGTVESAEIEAGGDVIVEELCMHSELIAVIGTPGGIKTKVQAGFHASLQERFEKTKSDLEPNENERESLEKLVAFFRLHPEKNKGDMMEKAQHTLNKLFANMVRLRANSSGAAPFLSLRAAR